MSRLNKQIRQEIINNAIKKSGVEEREVEIISRRAKLAEDVRVFDIGGSHVEIELMEKVKKINAYIKKKSTG